MILCEFYSKDLPVQGETDMQRTLPKESRMQQLAQKQIKKTDNKKNQLIQQAKEQQERD